jgi:septum formation protein
MDKAGAYAIQGEGALIVQGIAGCYYNVVGFPIARLEQMLLKKGVSLFDYMQKGKRRQ